MDIKLVETHTVQTPDVSIESEQNDLKPKMVSKTLVKTMRPACPALKFDLNPNEVNHEQSKDHYALLYLEMMSSDILVQVFAVRDCPSSTTKSTLCSYHS